MIIRKGRIGENEKIVSCANAAFIPVRYPEFDFHVNMKKIYDGEVDYSPEHFLAEEDNKIVGVAGNILTKFYCQGHEYLTSFVGSVAVIPEYQNRFIMRKMMEEIDRENKEKNVVFSVLTGDRTRYNHYGYEKIGFDYYLTVNRRRINQEDLTLNIIEIKENCDQIKEAFHIYLENDFFKTRKEDNFYDYLITGKRKVYLLKIENQLIGYFSLNKNLQQIDEIYLTAIDLLNASLKSIFNYFGKDELTFVISSLNKPYLLAFNNFAETTAIKDNLLVKVYNLKEFLKLTFNLNKIVKKFEDKEYIYRIEDEIYKISIKNQNIEISIGEYAYQKYYPTRKDFLRHVFTLGSIYDERDLSLLFSISYADLF